MAAAAAAAARLVAAVRAGLLARADAEVAVQAAAYFKGVVEFWGVKTPAMDAVYDACGPRPPPAVLHAAAAALLADSVFEMKHVGVYALYRGVGALARDAATAAQVVDTVEAAFDGRHVYDWATCDGLSSRVLAACAREHRSLAERVAAWRTAPYLWKQRAAAVTFVKLTATPLGYQPLILDVATHLAGHPERFVQLGVGWMLRELSVSAPATFADFMAAHGAAMSREGLRYAVEKLPSEQRARLLAVPRASPLPAADGSTGSAAAAGGAGSKRPRRVTAAAARAEPPPPPVPVLSRTGSTRRRVPRADMTIS